ncbi:MAG: aminotransferase class III-fold pyridoxal phosphate-dependent enzyme [Rhodospirillales bacterium]|nr:aminotransferase class III-fold pyridoxal phosphate-dependent enzyme [Rhodospirillales bacterium]
MRRNADLDTALAEAHAAYTAAHPESLARHRAAAGALPGGNTRSVLFYAPFPLTMLSGAGCHLRDADGVLYVDLLGDYTAGLYGHSEPRIAAAIRAALENGLSLGAHNEIEARYAAAVQARFPVLERLRFANSGTEANLLALATACAVTGRKGVLAFTGGYHGSVFTFAPGRSGKLNAPYDFVTTPYNDAATAVAAIAGMGERLAAVILEPMQGSGGCIPAEPGFVQAVAEAARAAGALLIVDEVMTSRLVPGGLHTMLGVRPDLVTLGKYLGGGLSFGAFGGRAEIMDRFDPHRPDALSHAGTFNNNTLSMTAGHAGLTEVFTPAAQAALNARGDALRARLNALCAEAKVAMRFSGIGSMMAVHFTARAVRNGEALADTDPRLLELFFFDMLAARIWLARRGMIALSLPVGEAECAQLADALGGFLERRAPLLGRADAE